MTPLLWCIVVFVVIGGPAWIAICAWYTYRRATPADPRIAIAENCIARSCRLGNAEFRAALIDLAADQYHAIALDSRRSTVANMYLRLADDCKAKARAIRKYALTN